MMAERALYLVNYSKNVSEYDHEIQQSHAADQPMAL